MTPKSFFVLIFFGFFGCFDIGEKKSLESVQSVPEVPLQEHQEFLKYDSVKIYYPEKTNFLGSYRGHWVFQTTSDSLLLTQADGVISAKYGFIGEEVEKVGSKIYLTGFTEQHIVILSTRGISFYDESGILVHRISDKLPYYTVRRKMFMAMDETDSVFLINPQISIFDFSKNRPDDPRSLSKYFDSYRALMRYSGKESKEQSNLILGFQQGSIFDEKKFYYPNYNTRITYDEDNRRVFFVHTPDPRIYAYDLDQDRTKGVHVDLPGFEVVHKTLLEKGMVGAQDLERARTLNSSVTGLEYHQGRLFLQYRMGLHDGYLGSDAYEKVNARVHKLLEYLPSNNLGTVYDLPQQFFRLEGATKNVLLFKSKREYEEFELYYTVKLAELHRGL